MDSSPAKWSVSVVIPAFNRERFLGAAIESALAQTVPATEIIVVDDGSTDRTGIIAGAFPSPVRTIRIENNGSGPSRPRNVGIAAARSEFITLLDSDDRLANDLLEKHRRILETWRDVGVVSSNFFIEIHRNGQMPAVTQNLATIVHSLPSRGVLQAAHFIRSSDAYLGYCQGNYIQTSGTSFAKRIWNEVGGFDESLRTSEDYAFFMKIVKRYDIVYIDEPLKVFTHHDENISSHADARFVPERALNLLRVLQAEHSVTARTDCRAELEKQIRTALLDLAYGHREAGSGIASLAKYLDYLASGGSVWVGVKGILKLPMRWLLRGCRRQRRNNVRNSPARDAVQHTDERPS